MSNGHLCCLTGVCCPPAAQEAAWAHLLTEKCAVPAGDAARLGKVICAELAPLRKVLQPLATVLGFGLGQH